MDKTLFPVKGLEAHDIIDERKGWPQILFRNLQERFITVLKWNVFNLNERSFWEKNADKIISLLHNRIPFEDREYQNEEDVVDFISKNTPIYSPQNKLDIVLEYFYNKASYDGHLMGFSIQSELVEPQLWRKYYFRNYEEFLYYLDNLVDQELIKIKSRTKDGFSLYISLQGLTKILQINEIKNSRFSFVAMSFSEHLSNVFTNAIGPAIRATGFEPLIVNRVNVESDKTINDAIIAGIKKSRFTIADFTEQKAGVYFEAGYALGRGQKVIYTCNENDMAKAHFDTRNFQHIVWKDEEDLKSKLIDKIEAYIKD